MTSIMTNASAMTALQSLRATNKALETTQGRISTGYRVAEAADNAAYWSIATTMRSDNKALGTVQDSLGLGASRIDVAYTAMNDSIKVIDEVKKALVSAKQPGLDKGKIQDSIGQLAEQLKGIAESATFSGPSWLSVNSAAPGYQRIETIVSSFSRTGDGAISIGTLDIDTADLALFDAGATGYGVLEQGAALAGTGGFGTVTAAAGTAGPPATAGTATLAAFGGAALVLDEDDIIQFDIAVDGGAKVTVTVDQATVNGALTGTSDGSIADAAEFATVINAALAKAGVAGVTAANSSGAVRFTSATTGTASAVAVTDVESAANGVLTDLADIDVTTASSAALDRFIAAVDRMTEKMISAASQLGAAKSRIDLQKSFIASLMDSIDRGVGQLVDADMSKESTKLQALQVQQQLGIQALSIANGNAQNVLALFRNG